MEMKKLLYIAFFVATSLFAQSAVAQVSKQVDVSKDYAPTVEKAQKLAIMPDMTDTVKMQPEIDYYITPRTYATSLLTENFRPATIAYWDYSHSRPLYLKAAVGMPLASEVDAYLSTYNKDKGYAMLYANHLGDYRDRYDISGMKVKDNTSEMSNRVGTRAGLFLGRRTLEADIYGDHQLRHRYPMAGERITFGKMQGKVRFGDDFTDMSRWNFNIEVGGGLFDHKERASESQERFLQSDFAVKTSMGKVLADKHLLMIHAAYNGYLGEQTLSPYRNNSVMAGLRYGFSGKRTNLIIGADYYYDKVSEATTSPHHILPYLHLTWQNSTERFVPFVEFNGELVRHDFASLMYENPFFVATAADAKELAMLPNEVKYNGRIGIGGNLGKGLFSYHLSAELSFADDHIYWYADFANYKFTTAYQHSLKIDGSMIFRPVRWFEAEFSAGVYAWMNYDDYYANRPNFESEIDLKFMTRKFKAEIDFGYASAVKWMANDLYNGDTRAQDGLPTAGNFYYRKTNGTPTLGVNIEWRISNRISLFAEAHNLTGSRVYEWLYYFYDTPQAMLGVKMTF